MRLIDSLGSIFNRNSTGELKHVTEALDQPISTLAKDISLLQLEYIIGTSTGEWLNEWGTWFGVARNLRESDKDYSTRILLKAVKPKNTIPALIDAIKVALNNPLAKVEVYEPHLDIFRLNISELSGDDKLQDGVYQRHAVVDIYINAPLPANLADVIRDVKSAGVKVYFTGINELGEEGEGTVLRFYSDVEPYMFSELETQLAIKQVDLFVVGSTLLGDRNGFISGRKLMFTHQYIETEFGKIRMARSFSSSRNTVLYEGDTTLVEHLDDYFNAVTYESGMELGTAVMIDEVIVTDETIKTTTIQTLMSPDVFANSTIPFNIFNDKTVLELYFHPDSYELDSQMESEVFTKPFAGSIFPIDMFLDTSIEDIDLRGTTFEQSLYSKKVQSETLPI